MNGSDCVTPPGDKIRKAIKWLSEAVLSQPEKSRQRLLEEAEIRYNLSPRECEFLNCNFGERPKED